MSELSNKWSRAATIFFINLLKEKAFLWNPKHPQRFNRSTRRKGFQDIQKQMEKAFPLLKITISDLDKKSKILRCQYKKEVILLQTNKKNCSSLWCYDLLSFFKDEEVVNTGSSLTPSELVDKKGKSYSRKTLIKLIRELRKYPLLWNRKHQYFNDRKLRAEDYHTMWLKLHKYFTLVEIKTKVKYFRRQFDLQYRKIATYKDKGIDIKPSLWCYKELSFLCPDYEDKHNDEASAHSSQSSANSDVNEGDEEVAYDDPEFVVNCDQSDIGEEIVHSNKTPEFVEKSTYERDSSAVDPFECIQLASESTTYEERFQWLGNKLVKALNRLHDESMILNVIKDVQSIISSAEERDSLILPVESASMLKFQQLKTEENQSTFHITLAFNSDNVNLNHLMTKISQLPALEKIELTGSSLKKVVF